MTGLLAFIRRGAMQPVNHRKLFLVLLACAALFVWFTSRALPEVAASHFGGDGAANGFMPRASYVKLMLLFVVALPLVIVFVPSISLNSPKSGIRLPNKEYWLAPERRDETVEFLRQHMARFGSMLVLFLCYIHWLVVRANAAKPPGMSSPWAISGIVLFVFCALMWLRVLMQRFGKVPE
jgi:uncharacterized membrane protein